MTGWLPEQERLIALFDTPVAWWLGLAVAVAVGAAHALAPGHGKTIAAAYLVGTRGRVRHAVLLGAIVAAMHTASVVVVALLWVSVSGAELVTAGLTAWMQVAAAGVVVAVGVGLVRRRLGDPGRHHHGHGRHHHHHHHHGGVEHAHVPPPDVEPWSRRGLVALGASGGLLPSPSAFLVLVSGILTGRLTDALVLVLAFAVGLAATLAGVGAVTVAGRDLVLRRSGGVGSAAAPLRRLLPGVGAVGVVVAGLVYLAAALPIALRA